MFGERVTPPSLHPRTLPVLITGARSWTTDQHVHTRDTAWNDKDAKEYCSKFFLEQHHMTIQVRAMDIKAGGGQHQHLIVCKTHKLCGWRKRKCEASEQFRAETSVAVFLRMFRLFFCLFSTLLSPSSRNAERYLPVLNAPVPTRAQIVQQVFGRNTKRTGQSRKWQEALGRRAETLQ